MSESNNLVECKYGHHMADRDTEFTEYGLKGLYKICRKCAYEKTKKYREKYREKFNESKKEYNRQWMANKRAQEKQNQQNELTL